MTFWNPDTIRASCGGTWLARCPAPPPTATGVSAAPVIPGLSTDSRAIRPGQVFLALSGDKYDGHSFLRDVVHAGASMLIIDNPGAIPVGGLPKPVGIVKVGDTKKALLKLAAAYRKTLAKTRVIAVAGSNGKTTTTRLIHAILSTRMRGTSSPKSFNNDVGVPLTILSARENDQYLLCEVGTNAPGEIATLAQAVQPDIAVITSIGREHLEGLGSLDGVAREEASLLSHLRPGGIAVVTADAPALTEHLKVVPNVVTFGREGHADLRLTAVEHSLSAECPGLRFVVNDRASYTLPLIGEHNALNALAAIAVARRLGVPDDQIALALTTATAPDMRLQRLTIGGVNIINDAYNANPESMIAALKTLVALGGNATRRIAILGDMLELGPAGIDAHREIGQTILDLGSRGTPGGSVGGGGGIDSVIIVGHLGLHTAERLGRGGGGVPGWNSDRYTLVSDLDAGQAAPVANLLRPGDLVLLKGSRRMRLERIIEALKQRFASSATPLATCN